MLLYLKGDDMDIFTYVLIDDKDNDITPPEALKLIRLKCNIIFGSDFRYFHEVANPCNGSKVFKIRSAKCHAYIMDLRIHREDYKQLSYTSVHYMNSLGKSEVGVVPSGKIIARNEEEVNLIGTASVDKCNHEYVNVGFTSIKLVCKHCDKEKA